jgi:hypothetical protein
MDQAKLLNQHVPCWQQQQSNPHFFCFAYDAKYP